MSFTEVNDSEDVSPPIMFSISADEVPSQMKAFDISKVNEAENFINYLFKFIVCDQF